jgi:cobalt-zinc-cadmium efflux system membrane fusion protein
LFVSGRIAVEQISKPVVVPKSAILQVEGKPTLFVRVEDGFEVRHVELGQADNRGVEIVEGLQAGETIVETGGFALKAELTKSASSGHGHGE